MPKKRRYQKSRPQTSPPTMAAQADIYRLYGEAVQCVEAEIDFVDQTFKALRKRTAYTLQEDFCGTANTAYEWIRRRKRNRAFGVDINPRALIWGQENNIAALNPEQTNRIKLLNENVLRVKAGPIDTVLAMNFSYWILKTRRLMLKYFKHVHANLVDDGIFFLDAFGGYEAYQELQEETEYQTFTYIWDQAHYNPITGHSICHIHFKFQDGSKINRAFSYKWRLWSLPELTEMLTEAGFKATVYWEGTDEDTNEGNGIFTPATQGSADAGWITYIVAEK